MSRDEKITNILIMLLTCFVISSNISAPKFIDIFGVKLTAGFFTYPFVYVIAAVIIATRGKDTYFFSIIGSYLVHLLFTLLMIASSLLPGVEGDQFSASLDEVFNSTNIRVLIASTVAYFISFYIFSIVFNKLSALNIKARVLISTFICALVDVNLFLSIAFIGSKNSSLLIDVMFFASIKKVLFQALLFPVTIVLISKIKGLNDSHYK
jgi:hypothetical protein